MFPNYNIGALMARYVRRRRSCKDLWWRKNVLFLNEIESEEYKELHPNYVDKDVKREWRDWIRLHNNWFTYRISLFKHKFLFRWYIYKHGNVPVFGFAPKGRDIATTRCSFLSWYWWTFSRVKRYYFIKNEIPIRRFVHPYHIVDPSPWPFLVSVGLVIFIFGVVKYLHFFDGFLYSVVIGALILVLSSINWWRDVIREATFEGNHTVLVQRGIRYGMMLFILSEVMFFFAFFRSFFHSSSSPAVEIGGIWPPAGINVLDPWRMPLLNTLYLLASGAWVTWAHVEITSPVLNKFRRVYFANNISSGKISRPPAFVAQICDGNITARKITMRTNSSLKKTIAEIGFTYDSRYDNVLAGILGTIAFGFLSTFTQWGEYDEATFTISDGIYGSVFYMATGFHGLHVIIGTLFLSVCLGRHMAYHFTRQHHVGFEAAIWYWHFVDVVWLFSYLCIYHWGS